MTDVGSASNTTTNTSSGYFSGTSGSGWNFDMFGDNATYSTNTLNQGVTIQEES